MESVGPSRAGTLGRRYMEAQCLSSDEFTALAFDGGYYDDGTYAHQALHNSYATDASLDWYSDVTAGITKPETSTSPVALTTKPASILPETWTLPTKSMLPGSTPTSAR